MSIIRVTHDTDLDLVRVTWAGKPLAEHLKREGRKAAAAAAHTIVGAAQNVRHVGGGNYSADYAAIRRTGKAAAPAAPAQSPTGDDDRLAFLERELARVTALLAAQTAAPVAPAAPAPEVKPVSESTAKVQAKIAASAALNCKVCRDLGVIRLTPRENGRWNFRSAKGAAETARKQPCTACQVAHTA